MSGYLAGPLMRGVAHVESEGVCAGVHEGANGIEGFSGGTESGEESSTAHAGRLGGEWPVDKAQNLPGL